MSKIATPEKPRPQRSRRIFFIGLAVVCVVLAVAAALYWHHTHSEINQRNAKIATVLKSRPVHSVLLAQGRAGGVGGKTTVVPLSGCAKLVHQGDSNKLHNSFAYLLTYDQPARKAQHCQLKQIVSAYGKPNASALIAGTYQKQKEVLLFYERGIYTQIPNKAAPKREPASVVPIQFSQLKIGPLCTNNTVVNIVAHEDDDLLFMNPAILHDIRDGRCVRTVYVTAGDAGRDPFYWLQRELGSKAAYSYMTPQLNDELWIDRIIKVNSHAYVTVSSPQINPRVSLIFMHLPDGNVDGTGFKASHSQSLAKLSQGTIASIQSVDGQSTYSSDDFQNALNTIITTYKPLLIRTQSQARRLPGDPYIDHSDHVAVSSYVKQVYSQLDGANQGVGLYSYLGYTGRYKPANITGSDRTDKVNTFLQYAAHDGSVCQTIQKCAVAPDYGAYLKRQYEYSY